MRALQAAVIVMGVLILGGTAAVIAIVAHRAAAPKPAGTAPGVPLPAAAATPVLLDEPPGTRIAVTAVADERLVLQLVGGGPDRVVVVELRGGAVVARVSLAR